MLVILQARMTSKRLPGKVLRPLGGKPMLWWTISRLRAAQNVSQIIVATSVDATDDVLAEFCASERVACFRGPLDDVAGRFAAVVRAQSAAAFVRICGDSPLIDPEIVDQGIAVYLKTECDVATNTQFRSFPKGQSVEVVNAAVFLGAYADMRAQDDLEHVTRYFYRRHEQYRIVNFDSGETAGDAQLSVDTEEDFHSVDKILLACDWKPGGWRQLWHLKKSQIGQVLE